jgi:uncharacterized protein (TIGR02284 family)
MSSDAEKNYELENSLKSVINVLEDGQKGMAEMGAHLKEERLKIYFLAESLARANFRGELVEELHRHGIKDVHEDGTLSGTLKRAWSNLKFDLGGGDRTLLETAEQGEDEAIGVYRDALNQELPLPLRELLTAQKKQIGLSHELVREQLNTLQAK